MYKALNSNLYATYTGNTLNTNLQTLLKTNPHFGNNPSDLLLDQTYFIGVIDNVNSNSTNHHVDVNGFMNRYSFSANEKDAINAINNQLNYIDINSSSNFLQSVEASIVSNTNISSTERKNILVYIAILNSSLAFWNEN